MVKNEKIREIAKNPDKVLELTKEEIIELLEKIEKIFEKEPKLIELPSSGKAVFVGDTHGDFDATKTVVKGYLQGDNKLVFLGDYVDRGEQSKENINYLLVLKEIYPENIFLLQGNHEGYGITEFSPADFWMSLDLVVRNKYASVLAKLPIAVSANDVIALHGALPNVDKLEDINNIKNGSKEWYQITWGDWQEVDEEYLGIDKYTGRPQFGKKYFDRIMKLFKKNVLIRSHQPYISTVVYDNRCLTIFTSHVYMPTRTIAVANLERKIKTINDLKIERI